MNGIAATFSAANRTDIYWLDTKFAMNHKSGNATDWNIPWDDLGGVFTSVPAAVAATPQSPTPHQLDVFGLGLDYAMYHKTFDGTNWTAEWENIGGIFISAPGVIERQSGRIDVFGVGLDYAMYHRFLQGGRWSRSWERLGGTFSSTASVVSFDPTRLDVFARGADFTLRHRYLVGSTWLSDWQNLGGSLVSPPVAVSWGASRLDVFAVGTDGGLWHRWWDGEIWSDWEDLGGSLTATPSAVSWGPNRLDVFALGTDSTIYHYWWDTDSWRGRESFGGNFTSGPTAISPAPNWINVIAPGTDNNLYDRVWNGAVWQPNIWGLIGSGHMKLPTRYRFSVDYVHVTTTRSLNADTDTSQASIAAGNWAIQTKTQMIGDIGGTHPDSAQLNLLNFEPVTVELCEAAFFNYLILNNGHADQKNIDAALVQAGTSLTSDSVSSVSKALGAGIGAIIGVELAGNLLAPVIGSLLGSLVAFLIGKLGDLVFADCDGLVAAEHIALTGRDLHLKTANGPLTMTTTHPGTDSPTGCGANSQYEVTWSIKRL
jgi:hypothetical protein